MKDYSINEIAVGSLFSDVVYLDQQFILATPEILFSKELIKTLGEWEFRAVYSEGEPQKPVVSIDGDAVVVSEEGDKLKQAETFYLVFQKYVENLFAQVIEKNALDFKAVADKIRVACKIIQENRRYLLRVQKNPKLGTSQNYLVSNSVNCLIFSIVIGIYLKLPETRLIELGVAALLYDIGMIQLPSKLYVHQRPLTLDERKLVLTHPILGYKLLKSFDFPLNISLAILEHHERENGAGYPRKLSGDKISLYAKILAVASSYVAITTSRPYKDARDGYTGMLDLLKNEGKQYNDTTVRALVYSLSMYPIGLYVLLSDGKQAQVVDVNPEKPKFPIVQVFSESQPDEKKLTLETSPKGVSIVRPLTKEEVGLLARH
ncbi:MAG: HD-GYP domain-containing protein [Treponema sp.]|jgi:HD-GYP domain-containing protein (c-di-GMP phosphodiesterase class II)|nr:HD-GYP domain-containing protein [Treponema sp.]